MIAIEDLVKDFGSFRAVDHVSFDVQPGEVVGFLGPNGAGKSTTLRVLTCYHPATSGRVRVHGLDVLRSSLEVRAGLGYLPENVPIWPDLRVEEYLRWRARLKGVPRRELEPRVAETMELAGVTEVRRKLVGHVSRGYRRRVGLADALIARPPLLILDEPTAGLDPNQRRKVRELVRALRGRHTILFSSHILSDVEDVCDRVVVIHRGKKRADGTLQSIAHELGVAELRIVVRTDDAGAGALVAGLPVQTSSLAPRADGFVELRASLLERDEQNRVVDVVSRRIRDAGFDFRELHVFEPSLEEIFYRLTLGADASLAPADKNASDEEAA
ncbi:MAG: ABC transporter ATP-binding protein [Planctomycetes bacterium]|nr:ABC transporter ATP-binding protein [Planctomycetota bacterium]